MFQIKVAEKFKTHILCSITVFENRAFYESMCKNTVHPVRPQTTMVHAHCMMDTDGYKCRFRMLLILIDFHCIISGTKAPQCYITVHCLCCCYYSYLRISTGIGFVFIHVYFFLYTVISLGCYSF